MIAGPASSLLSLGPPLSIHLLHTELRRTDASIHSDSALGPANLPRAVLICPELTRIRHQGQPKAPFQTNVTEHEEKVPSPAIFVRCGRQGLVGVCRNRTNWDGPGDHKSAWRSL